MFKIFHDEEEPMDNSTQVRELFRRVQHPQLQDTAKAIEVRAELDGIKYLEAANHLTAAISNTPEYQFYQKVFGVQSSGGNIGGNKGGGVGPRKGVCNSGRIYNYQGKVHPGYYQNWKSLIEEDRKTVMYAHKKKGSKSSQTAIRKDVSETKRQLSRLSTNITEMKASIAAFSDKPQRNSCSEANSVQEDNVSGYAGNYFGGHTSKCTKA